MRTFAFLTAAIASLVFTTNAGVIKRMDVRNGVIIEGRSLANIKRGLPITGSLLSPLQESAVAQSANILKRDAEEAVKIFARGEEENEGKEEKGEGKEEKEEGEGEEGKSEGGNDEVKEGSDKDKQPGDDDD